MKNDNKVRIVIDCENENHRIEIGDAVTECSSLEELGDAVEATTLKEVA